MHDRDPTSKCQLRKVSVCTTEIQLPNVNCAKSQPAQQIQVSPAQSLDMHNRDPDVKCAKSQTKQQKFKCHVYKVLTCMTEIQMSSVQGFKPK